VDVDEGNKDPSVPIEEASTLVKKSNTQEPIPAGFMPFEYLAMTIPSHKEYEEITVDLTTYERLFEEIV
jgi:hypothetical protein